MLSTKLRGRLTLLAIAAIFVLPIGTAMYMYFGSGGWRPAAQTQRGNLITPPRLLPDTALTAVAPAAKFRDLWSMVVLAGDSCATDCQRALVKIRQIRLSLGPKMTRMQTVFMPVTEAVLNQQQLAQHPKLIVADPAMSASLRALFGDYNSGQIFLVDPMGNLMMSYPINAEMADIRKDVGHLFTLSTIG